jgi:hypothetical protein
VKPNVTVRSNIFVRSHFQLRDDSDFIAQVRGRTALLCLLGRISSLSNVLMAARACLSQRQVAEIAWEVPCVECSALPEGAITRMGHEEVEFRCPKGKCEQSKLRGRTILLDPQLVQLATSRWGKPLSEVLQDALKSYRKEASQNGLSESTHKRPFTIRTTLSQHYFFSDPDIEGALARIVRGNDDE